MQVNHKYNQQQQQPIYGHTGHGGGGGSNQGSPSSTPHVRAPPRHQFISQQNPVTHVSRSKKFLGAKGKLLWESDVFALVREMATAASVC